MGRSNKTRNTSTLHFYIETEIIKVQIADEKTSFGDRSKLKPKWKGSVVKNMTGIQNCEPG